MARSKSPANDRVRVFADLVRKAPKHQEVILKTKLAGWLYKTDQKDAFILQTNDGSSYEFQVTDVDQFAILHESESKIAVQIEVALDKASQGALRAVRFSSLLGTAFHPQAAIPNRADELSNDESESSGGSSPGIDPFGLRDSRMTLTADPFGDFGQSVQVSSVSDPFFTIHGPVKSAS